MAQSQLLVRVGANLDALNADLKRAETKLKQFSAKMTRLGTDLSTKVSLPLAALGTAAVKSFAEFDRLEKGLSALNGSAEAGAASFRRLNEIVLDTRTTLDLKTAALGAQRLQGAGLSAAFAERTIKQLGIAATVSGSAIDDVGGVIRQFTQIVGKGKIEQEDLNTILDRMPALGAVIKKEFGASTAEGIRETGISMEAFVSRLTTAIEQNKDFQNVQGGLAKAFESFGNAVQTGIRPLGEAIAKALDLEKNLKRLSDFITKTSEAFAALDANTQRTIIGLTAAIAVAGPLVLVISGVVKVFSVLSAVVAAIASPIGIAVVAIGSLVAAFTYFYRTSEKFRAVINGIGASIKAFFTSILDGVKTIIEPLRRLANGDFKGAAEAFGDAFVNGNPISLFANAAVASANAYTDSFNKTLADAALDKSVGNLGTRGRLGGGRQSDLNPQAAPVASPAAISSSVSAISSGSDGSSANSFSVFNDQASAIVSKLSEISKQAQRTGTSLREMAANSGLQADLGRSIEDLGLKVQLTGGQFKNTSDTILSEYEEKIAAINDKMVVFGSSFDGTSAQIAATTESINAALAEGFDPLSETIVTLTENLTALQEETSKLDFGEALAAGLNSFTGAITNLAEQGAISFRSLATAALSAASDIIGALIKQGVTSAITNTLQSAGALGPLAIPIAAGAGTAASALFKAAIGKITAPKLAKGGIIPPGFSGDRFPALLNSGEAVIPIDRLMDTIAGGNGSGEFVLRGSDLVLLMGRANYNNSRITGK